MVSAQPNAAFESLLFPTSDESNEPKHKKKMTSQNEPRFTFHYTFKPRKNYEYRPTQEDYLWAYLAEKNGYIAPFKLYLDTADHVREMEDASGEGVHPIPHLVLHYPDLIGHALVWLANNGCNPCALATSSTEE